MKQFIKLFFPVAGIVLGIQLFGALAFRLTEGSVIQYPVPIICLVSTLGFPSLYVEKALGKKEADLYAYYLAFIPFDYSLLDSADPIPPAKS